MLSFRSPAKIIFMQVLHQLFRMVGLHSLNPLAHRLFPYRRVFIGTLYIKSYRHTLFSSPGYHCGIINIIHYVYPHLVQELG